MSHPHYSLKHQEHQKYICRGLSSLQQNEELVDMTIAADGHFVKVHKIIMSLASPYFKQIIAATGGHPVVYLNKVSYSTLCSILEYIYMGESRIEADKLEEFTQVSKDLHITGLDDLIPQSDLLRKPFNTSTNDFEAKGKTSKLKEESKSLHVFGVQNVGSITGDAESLEMDETYEVDSFQIMDDNDITGKSEKETNAEEHYNIPLDKPAKVQFTISNQGTLQAIFNRFIYSQCYVYKKNKNMRQWRCSMARYSCKCPATLVTDGDRIVKRNHAHNHAFQDITIMKKLKKNSIFSAITDAETHVTSTPQKCRVDSDSE